MRVALVLRSGGEYRPEHVTRLAAQIREHLPGASIVALSDVNVPGVERIPLKHTWGGWWAKLELFRPDIAGDLLYFDLDTTVVSSLADIAAVRALTLYRNPYRPRYISSGLMYLPADVRAEAWARWHPQYMHVFCGDGDFLHHLWIGRAQTWDVALPGQVVSYKCHVMLDPKKSRRHTGDGTVPPNARVVCFHGNPRPWAVPPLKVS